MPPGEALNGRIEKKVDRLIETVSDLRVDMATMVERTEQMQLAQLTAAKTRASTCPMTSLISQCGVRVEAVSDDISEDRVDIGNLKKCGEGLAKDVGNHEVSLTVNRRLMAGVAGLVVVIGGIVSVLAGTGVI